MKFTSAQVAQGSGGRVLGPPSVPARLVTDSRTLEPGQAFVAVRGERYDGHHFVDQALRAGAPFVVVSDPAVVVGGQSAVVVDDTVEALCRLAAGACAGLGATVVAITGSTGKTLTKDFVAAAAAGAKKVHANPGNLNTKLGLPLTILDAPGGTELLVLEMGARHRGDIASLCRIAPPDIGVITGIGLAHLGVFGGREAIAEAKSELVRALAPGGLAVLPSDGDHLDLLQKATAARVVTVGPGGYVRALRTTVGRDGRPQAQVAVGRTVVSLRLPVLGRPLLRNAMMALAVAVRIGMDPAGAADAIADASPARWRMQGQRAGGVLIINDAYNSNPSSAAAALRTVRELAGNARAWAVLGEMAELGDEAPAHHESIGRLARALGVGVIALPPFGSQLGGLSVAGGDEAISALVARVRTGDAVIVKASRAAGLEDVAARLARRLDVKKARA